MNKWKPTLNQIEYAIARRFGIRQYIIVPNISWGLNIHEMDLAVVSKSNYLYEVEIKRSKSDFKNDFKKGHNHIDRANRIKHFYYALPDWLYDEVKDLIPDNCGIIILYQKQYDHQDFPVYASIKRTVLYQKGVKPLYDNEIKQIMRLGCMRIWKLKRKLDS